MARDFYLSPASPSLIVQKNGKDSNILSGSSDPCIGHINKGLL